MSTIMRIPSGGGIGSAFSSKRTVVYASNAHNPTTFSISDSRVSKSGNTWTFTADKSLILEVYVSGLSNSGGSASVTSTGTELFRQSVGSAMGYWGGGAINGVFKLTVGQTVSITITMNTGGGDHAHGGALIIYEY